MPVEYKQRNAKKRLLERGNASCNWPLEGHRTSLNLEIPLGCGDSFWMPQYLSEIPWIPEPMEGPGNAVADDLEC